MPTINDGQQLADYCRRVLPLAQAELGTEFGYPSVVLSVIDAVWSIGVRYEGVTNVVSRYCAYLGCTRDTCTASLTTLTNDMARKGIEF